MTPSERLAQADSLPPDDVASIQAIHAAAIRMRAVLWESSSA